MKQKSLLVALFITSALLVACSSKAPDSGANGPLRTAHIQINHADDSKVAEFTAEVAEDPKTRAKGLMHREQLDTDAAMIFVFRGEGKQVFWNKDVTFPIDMLFANGYGEIEEVVPNVPPCLSEGKDCPLYGTKEHIMYVLEVNGGASAEKGIVVGDKITSPDIVIGE